MSRTAPTTRSAMAQGIAAKWYQVLLLSILGTGCSLVVIDADHTEAAMKDWADTVPGQVEPVTVECPDEIPLEAGEVFTCSVADSSGTYEIEATVLNDQGEVEWRQATIDSEATEEAIRNWAEDLPGQAEPVIVDCPDNRPIEADYTFLCEVFDGTDNYHARVTVLNDSGDLEWELR